MTDDRLGQVQELVAQGQGALALAAERLNEFAKWSREFTPEAERASAEAQIQKIDDAAKDLLALRRGLLDLLELSLPDEIRDRLRGAFTAVGILEAEDRRALAEMVAERPILSLADLTTAEAERLFVEIRKQEEPF